MSGHRSQAGTSRKSPGRQRPIRIMQVLEATRDGTRRYLKGVVAALSSDELELHVVCAVRRDPTFVEDVETYRRAGHAVTILPMTRGPHL